MFIRVGSAWDIGYIIEAEGLAPMEAIQAATRVC
jgi:hypothetical protein